MTRIDDCEQDGVCATPPGCERHWSERNGELVAENAALTKRVAELESQAEGYRVAIRNLQSTIADLESKLANSQKRVAELEEELRCRAELYTSNETVLRKTSDDLQWNIRNLQSQLAWTPVAKGLPTEPGLYVFLHGGCNGTLFELEKDGWYNHDTGDLLRTDGGYESLDSGYWDCFRRIELPEAK